MFYVRNCRLFSREGHLPVLLLWRSMIILETIESQQVQVGPMDRWSVHVAELILQRLRIYHSAVLKAMYLPILHTTEC